MFTNPCILLTTLHVYITVLAPNYMLQIHTCGRLCNAHIQSVQQARMTVFFVNVTDKVHFNVNELA